uniref:non-specific serine/threonine protein kinase n=1 Tax=Corethron hystrix TaxID=216773 RepID=A0A6U5FW69_9STRA
MEAVVWIGRADYAVRVHSAGAWKGKGVGGEDDLLLPIAEFGTTDLVSIGDVAGAGDSGGERWEKKKDQDSQTNVKQNNRVVLLVSVDGNTVSLHEDHDGDDVGTAYWETTTLSSAGPIVFCVDGDTGRAVPVHAVPNNNAALPPPDAHASSENMMPVAILSSPIDHLHPKRSFLYAVPLAVPAHYMSSSTVIHSSSSLSPPSNLPHCTSPPAAKVTSRLSTSLSHRSFPLTSQQPAAGGAATIVPPSSTMSCATPPRTNLSVPPVGSTAAPPLSCLQHGRGGKNLHCLVGTTLWIPAAESHLDLPGEHTRRATAAVYYAAQFFSIDEARARREEGGHDVSEEELKRIEGDTEQWSSNQAPPASQDATAGSRGARRRTQFGGTGSDSTLGRKRKQQREKTWVSIMSSWLPPVVALFFVISFEFGRRQRMKKVMVAVPTHTAATALATTTNGHTAHLAPPVVLSPAPSPNTASMFALGHAEMSVGVLRVYPEILGLGGHGTVVYRGNLEGRQVAVKRMLRAYNAAADREISLLIESDGHPNVVRYFLKEVAGEFVYLALELCELSLQDAIVALVKVGEGKGTPKTLDQTVECPKIAPGVQHALWQIARGVRHLHRLHIVHRDLKPQNILLARERGSQQRTAAVNGTDATKGVAAAHSIYRALHQREYIFKISDMGLGKQLTGQSSCGGAIGPCISAVAADVPPSTGVDGAGPGTVGWQAPEVMSRHAVPGPRRSVDIFSLGCIFYAVLLPGTHPYGEWFEREANIMRGRPSMERLLALSAEAHALVKDMLARDPKARPTAAEVCGHPFFWEQARRLSFLCEFSDRLESDHAEQVSDLIFKVERNAAEVVGLAWNTVLDEQLLLNVNKYRAYDPSSVRDCLRLLRNKKHHYNEIPATLKETLGLGCNALGLLRYFEERFSSLLMHCYQICRENLQSDDNFMQKYDIPPLRQPMLATNGFHKRSATPEVVEKPSIQSSPKIDIDLIPKYEPNRHDLCDSPDTIRTTINHTTSIPEEFSAQDTQQTVPLFTPPHAPLPTPCPTITPPAPPPQPDYSTSTLAPSDSSAPAPVPPSAPPLEMVIWTGSEGAKSFNCRGWFRSGDAWQHRTSETLLERRRDVNILRCATEPKFRTRLCNHWDLSGGITCPLRKKNKCVFAHGPLELRVKEGKRGRWGKLVDKDGNHPNPCSCGGEDTLGAAKSTESLRKEEGKWKSQTEKKGKGGGTKHKTGGGGAKHNGSQHKNKSHAKH